MLNAVMEPAGSQVRVVRLRWQAGWTCVGIFGLGQGLSDTAGNTGRAQLIRGPF